MTALCFCGCGNSIIAVNGTPYTQAQESTASEPPKQPAAAILPACSPAAEAGHLPPNLGFPKAKHLRKRADFERVYQQGKRHFSSHLTVFFLPRTVADATSTTIAATKDVTNPDEAGTRVGFTVGRALGGAVDRNRLKRRLREAVRHEMASLTAPVDIVIHPKRTVLTVDFTILRKEMAAAFVAVEQGKGAPPQPRQARSGKRVAKSAGKGSPRAAVKTSAKKSGGKR